VAQEQGFLQRGSKRACQPLQLVINFLPTSSSLSFSSLHESNFLQSPICLYISCNLTSYEYLLVLRFISVTPLRFFEQASKYHLLQSRLLSLSRIGLHSNLSLFRSHFPLSVVSLTHVCKNSPCFENEGQGS